MKHKLSSKPYFSTFDTEEEAVEYRETLKSWLARGIVPLGIELDAPSVRDPLVVEVVRSYEKLGPITPFDSKILSATIGDVLACAFRT